MEQRLIDANNVISVLQNIKNSLDGAPANPVDIRAVILAVMDIVKEQPAVDAVPVVRCGECRWHYVGCTGLNFCERLCKQQPQQGPVVRINADDFCSYGESRTPPAE